MFSLYSDGCETRTPLTDSFRLERGGQFESGFQNDNRHRSIIIAKGGKYWIYTYLFAKKDRSNIDTDELAEFKKLAALYGRQTDETINAQIINGDLVEICHAQQT